MVKYYKFERSAFKRGVEDALTLGPLTRALRVGWFDRHEVAPQRDERGSKIFGDSSRGETTDEERR